MMKYHKWGKDIHDFAVVCTCISDGISCVQNEKRPTKRLTLPTFTSLHTWPNTVKRGRDCHIVLF